MVQSQRLRAFLVTFLAYFASLGASTPLQLTRQSSINFATNAQMAINQLQQTYNQTSGLYGDNLWWNSANIITVLADFQEYFPSYVEQITNTVFPHTLAVAPRATGNTNFLNAFYDDELWWVLAWIKVFDVTKDNKYLDTASVIFENSKVIWGSSPCGGLWWDKKHSSDNAIENSLYLTAAAKLANRKPSTPSGGYYLNEAIKAHDFIVSSGLINTKYNLLNDGLLAKSSSPNSCKNNNGIFWSYNQGALLSGLVELTWATGNHSYEDLAITIASAAIDPKNVVTDSSGTHALTDSNGILHDTVCENGNPPCSGDGGQFKGVFMRNLQFMVNRANLPADVNQKFSDYLRENANSIWDHARSGAALGPVWSGPYTTASVQSQSSALDAIVGAACVS